MLKFFRLPIIMGLMLATASMCFAQTADELKAEREQFAKELKSKNVKGREKKLIKLNEKASDVKTTGLQSVDGLSQTAAGAIIAVVAANETLAKFKTELKENANGEIDITSHKAKLEDYVALAASLGATTALVAAGTEQIKNAKDDAKALSPMQARPVLSSVNFSSDALKLSGEELAFQTKLIKNLIASIKAAKNL